MKKIEKDFLKDFSKSMDISYSYDDLKDQININRFSSVEHKPWKRWVILVVSCFMFLVIIGGSVFAISAEAKEYNNAVQFFNSHELSAENLSRREIKAIYRDITTNSFLYEKTGEVISKSFVKHVAGYEIPQEAPTPEEIANLWNYLNKLLYGDNKASEETRIKYNHYSTYSGIHMNGQKIYDKGVFEKYDDDTLIWKLEFIDYRISDYKILEDMVLVYGINQMFYLSDPQYSWIAAIDNDGNILWLNEFHNGLERELLRFVIDNRDNTIAIITYGDFKYLCISQIDYDGNVLKFNKTEVGYYYVLKNATLFQDGYLMQLISLGSESKIVKVDKDANIEESYLYETDDYRYNITDMIEYNNKIYLSAYSVPISSYGESGFYPKDEIKGILTYLYEKDIFEISSEELTSLLRTQYTAFLLVVDNESGIPQEFYSIEGSLGAKLSYSESGQLLWDVESITSTYYSPSTGHYKIDGVSKVYQYSFDNDGILIWQKDTGEVVQFRR